MDSEFQVANIVGEKYGFDEIYGSCYEVENGRFTGEIIKHLGHGGKLESLLSFCKKHEINLQRCIAIGDSDSDIELFEKFGKSIAINYSNILIGKASVYIKTDNLRAILEHF